MTPVRLGARSRPAIALAVAALAAPAMSACAPVVPPPSPPPSSAADEPQVRAVPQAREVTAGLAAPWSVVFLGDGTPLVSERDTGEVREILGDGTTRIVGTIADAVHGGEGGLLGLAVHGDELYVYSTARSGNRIQRFALTGSSGGFALGEGAAVIDGLPAAGNHNGGRIAFGPDGMLYATVGDAGAPRSAQDPDALAGKLLRMTPEGEVPADNPTPGSLVYSLGHRNPQGIGWAQDGRLFLAEFGQDTWDELNIIEPGGNYGWPEVEGVAGDPRFIDPVQQWATDVASPSGLAVTGDTIYLANLRGQRLRAIPVADPGTATDLLVGQYGRLRAAVAGPDDTLWIVTNNTDGRGEPRPGDDRIVSIPLSIL